MNRIDELTKQLEGELIQRHELIESLLDTFEEQQDVYMREHTRHDCKLVTLEGVWNFTAIADKLIARLKASAIQGPEQGPTLGGP